MAVVGGDLSTVHTRACGWQATACHSQLCAGGNCCVEGHGDPHIISDSITGSSLLWFSGWGQLLKPGSAARGPQECP